MSVSAGGSVSVGWHGVDKCQPPICTSVLPCLSFALGLPAAVPRLCPHAWSAPLIAGSLTVLQCCLADTISFLHDITEQASEIPL